MTLLLGIDPGTLAWVDDHVWWCSLWVLLGGIALMRINGTTGPETIKTEGKTS